MTRRGTIGDAARKGARDYRDILRTIHDQLQPEMYLEIGIHGGRSFELASCRAIGVDPDLSGSPPPGPNDIMIAQTSDEFFETQAHERLADPPDLVFIDGMHLFENALRDFMNCERYAKPTTLIVLDDVFPSHPRQAQRERVTNLWTGDVWKLYECLKVHRKDLLLLPLDASPTGMLLIAGLDPNNDVLWQQYNPIIRRFNTPADRRPPRSILRRKGSVEGTINDLQWLLSTLKNYRHTSVSPRELLSTLKQGPSDQDVPAT